MNEQRERMTGAALFLVLIGAGWAPYLVATMRAGFYDAPAVLFGGLCGIVAAAFTYNAAERMLGAGRGVYASAVLATFIPTAIVISEPPLMSYASLLFVTSAALWMAARATESNVREALALIGLLSGVVLAVFGVWPPAMLPLLALFVLRARVRVSMQAILATLSLALLGIVVEKFIALPSLFEKQPDVAVVPWEAALLMAPWAGFVVCAAAVGARWYRYVLISLVLLAVLHGKVGGEWLALLGVAGPFAAIAIAAFVLKWFEHESENRWKEARWMALIAMALLLVPPLARIAHWEQMTTNRNWAMACVAVATALVVGMIKDNRRWLFGVHALAGMFIGSLWWYFWPQEELYMDDDVQSALPLDIVPWFFVAFALVRITVRVLYGRRMPRSLRKPVAEHSFEPVMFRRFDELGRAEWSGAPVAVNLRGNESVEFAIFGDTAGSEFPFSSRRSGYAALRALMARLIERKPRFVVSTGDLATQATHLAYRRLRKTLGHLPLPFITTPGNHDLVERRIVQAQYFRALFGSDHGDITVGPARLILINNAWGSLSDAQLDWVETTLARPTEAAFTLVFCHKPIFDPRSDAYYGMEHRPHAEWLHERFARAKISAVFSGHIHSLLHTERDGVNYVISGGGGSKLKNTDDRHHYLWCRAAPDHMRITAHDVAADAVLFELTLTPRR